MSFSVSYILGASALVLCEVFISIYAFGLLLVVLNIILRLVVKAVDPSEIAFRDQIRLRLKPVLHLVTRL